MSVLTSNPVFGQGPGERVRITTSGGKMIGTVSEKSGEAFNIRLQGGRFRSVALSDIRNPERSLEKRNNAKKGCLIGGST